jgi:PEP-CTERM motif-containing protein
VALVASAPEPGSLVLVSLGFVGLAFALRRKLTA